MPATDPALPSRTTHPGQCSASGQCSRCGGVFPDWNGGTCDACKNLPSTT